MGKQRLGKSAARRAVLGELRLVEIDADDDAALRSLDQRLDDLWVRENVRGHVDGQASASDLARVNAFKVFARRVVDVRLGPFNRDALDLGVLVLEAPLRPSRRKRHRRHASAEKQPDPQGPTQRLNQRNLVVVSGCKYKVLGFSPPFGPAGRACASIGA